jgi:hypothetical protein
VAEAVGGFGPLRVVWICTDLSASKAQRISTQVGTNMYQESRTLLARLAPLCGCMRRRSRGSAQTQNNFEVELFGVSDWLVVHLHAEYCHQEVGDLWKHRHLLRLDL